MTENNDEPRCENCNARLHKERDIEAGRCAGCIPTPESEAGEYVNIDIMRESENVRESDQ